MYDELLAWNRVTSTLDSISRLVQWDQETYMPAKAGPFRAEEHALLASMKHERVTDDRFLELIEGAESESLDERQRANVRELKRMCHLKRCLPTELVAELARTGSQAQDVWKEARRKSDFAMFAPWLEKMVDLARRKAECYGTPDGGEPYDALMNEYEPGARASEVEAIFTPLGDRLSAFLAELREGTPPDTSALDTPIAPDKQHAFGLFILESLGFDLEAG
ncbi:MAG: hypothetical protein KDA28_01460, partial [Phycisphaerales bacterium]|nr:hypothetical protein [Phycisphaerales bacterium]